MDKDILQTKDLPEAAYLLANKQKLLFVEREKNSKTYWFVFSNKEKCKKLCDEFWFGNSKAKKYYQSLQILKNKIFSQPKYDNYK